MSHLKSLCYVSLLSRMFLPAPFICLYPIPTSKSTSSVPSVLIFNKLILRLIYFGLNLVHEDNNNDNINNNKHKSLLHTRHCSTQYAWINTAESQNNPTVQVYYYNMLFWHEILDTERLSNLLKVTYLVRMNLGSQLRQSHFKIFILPHCPFHKNMKIL